MKYLYIHEDGTLEQVDKVPGLEEFKSLEAGILTIIMVRDESYHTLNVSGTFSKIEETLGGI